MSYPSYLRLWLQNEKTDPTGSKVKLQNPRCLRAQMLPYGQGDKSVKEYQRLCTRMKLIQEKENFAVYNDPTNEIQLKS